MHELVAEVEFESVLEFGNQRYTGPGEFKTTKAYYESLGCKRYVALDVNEDKDAIIADLNEPVDLGETFDLVTNNGTGEHIFDQRMVFENAHNLSHRYMLHVLPMLPWVNHGFFNFQPILFRDLAYANRYKYDVRVGNRWGKMKRIPDELLFKEKNPIELAKAVAKVCQTGETSVIAFLEKTSDAPFKLPFQGKYQHDIADDSLRERYG